MTAWAALLAAFAAADRAASQEAPTPPASAPAAQQSPRRDGDLVQVELPIDARVQERLEGTLRRLAEKAPAVAAATDRPVVVLEFDTANGRTGRGSRFGSCTDLARFLTGPEMSRLELVAYVPAPRGFADPAAGGAAARSELTGHAVLVALACSHLVMHQDSAIGSAGADESTIDEGLRQSYRQIAANRLTLPVEVALSMLDPEASLYRVDLSDGGVAYVDREQLRLLEGQGKAVQSETLTEQGSLPLYSSQLLAKVQLLRHRVASRREIAERFRLNPDALEGDPSLGGEWVAAELHLDSPLDAARASWITRSLSRLPAGTNLLLITFDAEEPGDVQQGLRLAQFLADFDENQVRTIAYVPRAARGAAALAALGCDHLVMGPQAVLGGADSPADPSSGPSSADLQDPLKILAAQTQRDWSLLLALVDSSQAVKLWTRQGTGQVRVFSDAQRSEFSAEEQGLWTPLRELDLSGGLSGSDAESLFIARYLIDDASQLRALYQIRGEPVTVQQTPIDRWIDTLARQLASPWIAAWLLFGAMFFLSTEMSTPGVGVPGFLGSLCLLLFFWSQYFNGNANWLEILLFVGGISFLLIELFVLPGFGIFGIGGLLMIIVSLVLATQTFVIPRTSDEFNRLQVSLATVAGAALGMLTALFFLRRYLDKLPIFKRLMLAPPGSEDPLESIDRREALVRWEHLVGQPGKTVTRLGPAGKAKIAGQIYDVTSGGELIEAGEPVEVIEVAGNRVVVRPGPP